jgi:hypothetical protein
MPINKYDVNHPAGPDAESRIRSRHRNSGSPHATAVVHEGPSNDAVRHITNVSDIADHTRVPRHTPMKSLLNEGQQ